MNSKKNTKVDPTVLSKVAVKLFFGIADEWNLNDSQKCALAGVNSRSTLRNWNEKIEHEQPLHLTRDTLDRLSYIAGIYKGIQVLFSEPKQWKEWIHKPNSNFGQHSPLEVMLQGGLVDLADVRRYIDGRREEQYL